ncbi:hypothetical protein G3480_16765 [Thiorhodococcus mannitoliphagus]|uniref:Uncharacterized protein n=1 Tax=Thiorhodococcus mannitoliphagus TaxID=329406 RepID=A0A6P1DUD3_9GAMM|nr:hypothetical protein [Thiorhodococcus mannitoliphagus]NEX21937.1 hypothetical protein [Thiorhodococcus mannitoliphagus]
MLLEVKPRSSTSSTPIGFPKATGTAAPSLRSQAILAWFARAGSPGYIKPIGGGEPAPAAMSFCDNRLGVALDVDNTVPVDGATTADMALVDDILI